MLTEQMQISPEEDRLTIALMNASEHNRGMLVAIWTKKVILHRCVVGPAKSEAGHSERSQSRTWSTEPAAESCAGSQLLCRSET